MKSSLSVKNIQLTTLIVFLSFILWPFSFNGFSMQLPAVIIVMAIVINYTQTIKLKISSLILLPLIFLAILYTPIIKNKEAFKFILYLLKISIFYLMTSLLIKYLRLKRVENLLLFSILPGTIFIAVIIFQISFEGFDLFLAKYLYPQSSLLFREFNTGGHPWRNLGWNGFLFASDGLSFSWIAILCLVSRKIYPIKKHENLLLSYELTCLIIAALGGRSAIPIIFLYFIITFFPAPGKIKIPFNIIIILITAFMYLSTLKGFDTLFFWFLEPFTSSISSGKINSHSLNMTTNDYTNFFEKTSLENFLLGTGFYFQNGEDYSAYNLIGSDSGFIRTINFGGIFTLTILISTFLIFLLKAIIKENRLDKLKFVYLIYTIYGFIFFYKSEWLYQNFFLFYFFFIYHLLTQKVQKNYGR